MNILNPAKCSEQNDIVLQESTKPDEGTIGMKNFIQGFINLYLTNKK
jgi:hypothetical protein